MTVAFSGDRGVRAGVTGVGEPLVAARAAGRAPGAAAGDAERVSVAWMASAEGCAAPVPRLFLDLRV